MASSVTEEEWPSILITSTVLSLALKLSPTPYSKLRSFEHNRLDLLIETFQNKIIDVGWEEIYIPTLCRAAAYLLTYRAHIPLQNGVTLSDKHVDRFLLDFCYEYTIQIGDRYEEPEILPFSGEVSVSRFAETWTPEPELGVFEVNDPNRECVFGFGDLEGLGGLCPVASYLGSFEVGEQ
jgi:hypothetical protein